MRTSRWNWGAVATAIVVLGSVFGHTATAAGAPPNILFILLDDMGWYEPGCYGGTTGLETPNIDRLAGAGMRFTRFTSYSMCSPSRTAIVTGRHGNRTGVISNVADPGGVGREVRATEIPFGKTLARAGYETACYGKLHLHWDNIARTDFVSDVLGFEHSMVHLGDTHENLIDQNVSTTRKLSGPTGGAVDTHFDTIWHRNGNPESSDGYDSDVLTDNVIGFMNKKRDRPFMVWLSYFSIHEPFQSPPRWKSHWNARKEELRPYFDECVQRTREAAALPGGRKELATYNPPFDMFINRTAMASAVDESIGRLLRALDDAGLAENTLVIFASDNGPHPIAGGGKATMCDDAVRVPLIVRWPGRIAPGTVCDALTESVDIYPTMVEVAGGNMPTEIPFDGLSLLPWLEGQTPKPWRKVGFTELKGSLGLYTEDWFMRDRRGEEPLYYARLDSPTILEVPADQEMVPIEARKLLTAEAEKHRKRSDETMARIRREVAEQRKAGTDVYGDRLKLIQEKQK